jgi:hypothetical protein
MLIGRYQQNADWSLSTECLIGRYQQNADWSLLAHVSDWFPAHEESIQTPRINYLNQ